MEKVNPKTAYFLNGGGEIANQLQQHDWSKTSIGGIENWPQSLKTTLSIVLKAPFPMLLFWGENHICFYNKAYDSSLRETNGHQHILGKHAADGWGKNWEAIKPILNEVYKTGIATICENQYVPKVADGEAKDTYWTYGYSQVPNDLGASGGVLLTCTETTEKTVQLKKLAEENDDLYFALESAELATFDYDPKTNRFSGNKRLKEWFGISENDDLSIEVGLGVIHENDRKRVASAIQEALNPASKGKYDVEYVLYINKDKTYRNVHATGRVLFNNKGEPQRFDGVIQDITAKKEAEEKLKQREEIFRGLAEALPQLVWMTSEKGESLFVSNSWYNYSGLDHTLEDYWEKIVHPADLEAINKAWGHSLQTGKNYEAEVRLKSKAGFYRWFLVRGLSLKNNDGKIERWVGAFTDIHEQKRKEQRKDEFISIATHEMKTPLTTAKGYLELLLLTIGKEPEDALLYANKASQAVGRLNHFVLDLLDATKIQNGKLTYDKKPVNLEIVLNEVVEHFEFSSKSHTIYKKGEAEQPVFGDKARLQQVFTNLISNAIKYSPNQNKITINITETVDKVQVAVQDFGVGMSSEHTQKIFDRYYRVQEHAIQFQGLGIGLYISNEIIKDHNGQLWVESNEGEGSTFYFTLPIQKNS